MQRDYQITLSQSTIDQLDFTDVHDIFEPAFVNIGELSSRNRKNLWNEQFEHIINYDAITKLDLILYSNYKSI